MKKPSDTRTSEALIHIVDHLRAHYTGQAEVWVEEESVDGLREKGWEVVSGQDAMKGKGGLFRISGRIGEGKGKGKIEDAGELTESVEGLLCS